MAHFQLIPRTARDDPKGDFITWGNRLTTIKDGTRLLVKGTAPETSNVAAPLPYEKVFVHLGNTITLQQVGNTGTPGEMPEIHVSDKRVARIVEIKRAGATQTVRLKAESAGEAVLKGTKPGGGADCVFPLKVVAGQFAYQPGMTHDLIAQRLGRSDDVYKLYYLQRILNNNRGDDNLFDQFSHFYVDVFGKKFSKELVCASVCVLSGEVLFGKVHAARPKWNNLGPHSRLYKPLKSRPTSMAQIVYDQKTVEKARNAIASSLAHSIPVRVGCAHHSLETYDDRAKRLDPTRSGGHSVLIVGCSAGKDRFFYLDPCEGMSRLKYEGGIGSAGPECQFLGLFTIESTASRGPVFKSASLEVLEAPTTMV